MEAPRRSMTRVVFVSFFAKRIQIAAESTRQPPRGEHNGRHSGHGNLLDLAENACRKLSIFCQKLIKSQMPLARISA